MAEIAQSTPDTWLYPPTVTAPPAPLPLFKFLYRFISNPLLSLPQPVYEEPIVVHWTTPKTCLAWICAPALTEEILLDKQGTFIKNDFEERILGPVLGDGILVAEGQHWRWQRRTMAPLFRHSDIRDYVPTMSAAAEETAEQWRSQGANKQIRAVDQDMIDLTFAIIARTMLAGGEPAETEIIKRAGADYLRNISWEMAFTLLKLPRWLPHPAKPLMRRSAKQLLSAVKDIVARRRAQPDLGDDLMARLLAARDPETNEPMSDQQVVYNLLTLLEAGHETTARALTWTLYLLARSPSWQDRVRDEVRNVAGDAAITAEHMDELHVTERVLKEGMRLYPPAAVIARTPSKPTRVGNHNFKPGDQLVIPIYCVHRHSLLWDDPNRFDPDRFLPEAEAKRPRTQFMPFGGGPRLCIGMSFAMAEAKVILATLVRAARFEWDGEYVPEPISRVTLRPRHGMPLRVLSFSKT